MDTCIVPYKTFLPLLQNLVLLELFEISSNAHVYLSRRVSVLLSLYMEFGIFSKSGLVLECKLENHSKHSLRVFIRDMFSKHFIFINTRNQENRTAENLSLATQIIIIGTIVRRKPNLYFFIYHIYKIKSNKTKLGKKLEQNQNSKLGEKYKWKA